MFTPDILFSVFDQLSSYDRSLTVTVCKGWYTCGMRCLSLIEKVPDLSAGDHLRLGHYHAIIRNVKESRSLIIYCHLPEDLWETDTLHMVELYVKCHCLYYGSRINGVITILSYLVERGHKESVKYILDEYKSHSIYNRLLCICFQAACVSKRIDILKMCRTVALTGYCIYDAIVNSDNNLEVIEEILTHYACVNINNLLDIAVEYNNDVLLICIIRANLVSIHYVGQG
jgi:hypothetical protein